MFTVGNSVASTGTSDYWLGKGNAMFPDPFFDMASTAMPTTMANVLRFCEFIVSQNQTYRQALNRIVSYFITDIDITEKEASREEKQKFRDFLKDDLGIIAELQRAGLDLLTYGNSFTSVMMPFKRYLSCPSCAKQGKAFEVPLAQVYNTQAFKFRWDDYQFKALCPKCGYDGVWSHRDRRSMSEGDVKIKRWNPHEIDILYDSFKDECAYIWKIPESYRRDIKRGRLDNLEGANWEVIKAIKANQHFRFDDGVIYHMKEHALSGHYTQGWGLSRVLTNFRQAWYVQILRRYNEALAADYVMPMRVITPAPRSGSAPESADPLLAVDLGDYNSQLLGMVAEHRRDPATYHTLGFPVEYQVLGGEARQLAPRELLAEGTDELLNGSGVPAELYRGSLSIQTVYTAIRLFESQHAGFVHAINEFLRFVSDQVSKLLSWEPIACRLLPSTLADDVNQQMAKLQLMLSRQISQTSGLQSLNLNFEEENRRMLEEERFVADEQARLQKDMENAQMQQMLVPPLMQQLTGMAAGGQPPAQGGQQGDPSQQGGQPGQQPAAAQAFAASTPQSPNKPMSVNEMYSQAQTIAQQLMSMPDNQRTSTLQQLKQTMPVIQPLVRDIMREYREKAQAQSQAGMASGASSPMAKMGAVRIMQMARKRC